MTEPGPSPRRVTSGEDLREVLRGVGESLPDLLCTWDEFEVINEIGRGGFGKVYTANFKRTGTIVALKEVFADRLHGDRFRRYILEIETMVHVISPYVISLVGFSVAPPYLIASEYISGGPLSQWTGSKNDIQPLSATEMTIVAIGMAYGLQLIHSKGILHRDLKGANVLLDADHYPHICDLGIARFGELERRKTVKLGTPTYAAPEVVAGGEYDSKADIFSYGIVVYEMIERKRAWKGIKNMFQYQEALFERKEKPKISEKTSSACKRLIRKCMHMDPAKRMSAADVIQYIHDHIDSVFPGTDPEAVTRYEQWAEKKLEELGDSVSGPAHNFAKRSRHSEKTKKGKEGQEALLNPDSPQFPELIRAVAATMRSKEVVPLLPGMVSEFGPDGRPDIQILYVDAIAKFGSRSSKLVKNLVEVGFYLKMPVVAGTVDSVTDLLHNLASFSATAITAEYAEPICKIADLVPENAVRLLMHFLGYVEARTVLTISLEVASKSQTALCASKASSGLIRTMADLASRGEALSPDAGVTVAKFLASPHDEAVVEAYRFLSWFCDPLPDVSDEILAAHLCKDGLVAWVHHFLAKAEAIPPTVALVSALLSRPRLTATWVLLTTLAGSSAGAECLLANPQWLDGARSNPKGAFRVLVVLGTVPAVRRALAALPEYPAFLAACCDVGSDDELLAAIPVVIRRTQISAGLLKSLSLEGFWAGYFRAVAGSQSTEVHLNCLVLVNDFVRAGWTEEFGEYLRAVTRLWSLPELAATAVSLLVSASYLPEGARAIAGLNILDDLEQLCGDKHYGPSAARILDNTSRFTA
jgi:serine/threonine protein kinase